jgi:hypothetical protein
MNYLIGAPIGDIIGGWGNPHYTTKNLYHSVFIWNNPPSIYFDGRISLYSNLAFLVEC